MKPKRITGHKLQQRRKRMLNAQPLCAHCQAQGRITLATELDHIIALCNGGRQRRIGRSE